LTERLGKILHIGIPESLQNFWNHEPDSNSDNRDTANEVPLADHGDDEAYQMVNVELEKRRDPRVMDLFFESGRRMFTHEHDFRSQWRIEFEW
jgi:hypothetical protein